MKRKTFAVSFVVLMVFALLLSACGTPATPTAAPLGGAQGDAQVGGGVVGDSQVGGGVPGQAAQVNGQNPAAAQLQAPLAQDQAKEAPAEVASAEQQAVEAAIPAVPAPGEYPTSPEGVVQAFLASYSDQPGQMDSYLTQAQSASGAASMLGFDGALEGFVIDAAAVNPEPPAAVVSAAVKVGGAEIRRTFTLGKEDGQWKIETIANEAN